MWFDTGFFAGGMGGGNVSIRQLWDKTLEFVLYVLVSVPTTMSLSQDILHINVIYTF